MNQWKILITDGLQEKGLILLRKSALVDDRTGIPPDELKAIIGEYDALIVRGRTKVTEPVFNAAGKLKVVGRAGVGVDNIDLAAAKARDIRVVNAPQATSIAVAELAMSLLLAVSRMVPFADHTMKEGAWAKKELVGVELYGKTLGIIGIGNIGGAVAHRAAAFGMEVIAHDILKTPEEAGVYGTKLVTQDELFAQSDYISIHVPLTAQSRGMIGDEAITKMKPGVRIVSTARGGVVDETAILAGLNSGHIAAAGLDVFAQEPPGKNELVSHRNLIATPHIGAQTAEAQDRAAVDISSEVLAALQDKQLRWKLV